MLRRSSAATPGTAVLQSIILADPNYVAHIPADLAAADAAPLICAGITTYKGIKETEASPANGSLSRELVGSVIWLSNMRRRWDSSSAQSTSTTAKLAHATRVGADFVINAKTGDPAAAVKKETCGGAHGVLITAPSLIAFKQGVGMTRKRGICVLVGLPPGEFPVPLFDVVANCITIRGSFVGTRQDMAKPSPSLSAARSKPMSSSNPYLRSTRSSTASRRRCAVTRGPRLRGS